MADVQRAISVSALLTPELVLPELRARTKIEVLEALGAHVGLVQPTVDVGHLVQCLHEREQQSTTALENGVAIPHVRVAGLAAPFATFARSTEGVDYGASDGNPTRLFLLLIVAAEQPGGHLKLLARAARVLSDAGCRSRLLDAASGSELLDVLREHEQRVHAGLRAA
jgi:mannitol/fructose-specific phosphotransferase system IIA component (Ntr-type)